MGTYCCCGVKKRSEHWKCECDWEGWYACFKTDQMPQNIYIKNPDRDGKYLVRIFEDGDDYEDESAFSLIEKNWGQCTNDAISNWEVDYCDGWMGYRGVYAWKENIKD